MKNQTATEWLIEQIKSPEWQDRYIWQKEEIFEEAKRMDKQQTVNEAKAFLESNGYFVRNLWHTDDVTGNYPECSEDDAHDILYEALTNEATYDQICLAIDISADKRNLIKQ